MHDGVTKKGRLFLVCEACTMRINNIAPTGIIMMSQVSQWMQNCKGGLDGLRNLLQSRIASLQATGSKIPTQIPQETYKKLEQMAEKQKAHENQLRNQ